MQKKQPKQKLTIEEIIKSDPLPFDIQLTSDGVGKYIPIENLETSLDLFEWGTQHYTFQIYKDGYANLSVAASIELVIKYVGQTGEKIIRTFVGTCNFPMNSLYPNTHWNATAKSECIKNAASDFGRKFGRGLNAFGVPTIQIQEKTEKKIKPDSKIMKHFKEAVESGDESTVIMLSNLYEIKIEENVTENQDTEGSVGQ